MAELGEELRRERVRRNLTFKDVEQVLHIKTTYLEAIEDGNYDIIPGQVYVKGFIRNYGNYLDLDGDRLVKVYQGQVGDIDTFSLRSVTRRKAQATPNLVQSEFVEYVNALLYKNALFWGLFYFVWHYFYYGYSFSND